MPADGGIWVFIEHRDGKLEDGSLELVGHGREIADKVSQNLAAVVFDDMPESMARQLARYGAPRVLCIQHTAGAGRSVETDAQLLVAAIEQYSPDAVLLLESITGAELARMVAARLATGLVTACDRLDVDGNGLLAAVKPIYGSKASATIICPTSRPQMATVNPDAIDLKMPDDTAIAETVALHIDVDLEEPRTVTVDFLQGDPRLVALVEAEIVVAGGMGLGSGDNWRLVQELADAVGGSVAATRRAVDEGWIASDRQIGLTGKTVRPKLYIACGISGAIQHTMGMKDARAIIAINTDREAPIFKMADVGVVGDVVKVLPALTAKLRETLKDSAKPGADKVFGALSNP